MKKPNLSKKSKENQPPKDLIDLDNSSNNESNSEKISLLFDYFNQKEGDSSIIKNWSFNFNSHSLLSFCEVLTTILQLAGKRIEITVEHIESDAFDIVLEEFQESIDNIKTNKKYKSPSLPVKSVSDSDDDNKEEEENNNETTEENNESESEESEVNISTQTPPLTKFLKDKTLSKTLSKFWHDLSEAMISNNALYSNSFVNFRQWLVAFSKSSIKTIRQSTLFCTLSLFNALSVTLNRSKNELERLTERSKEGDSIPIFARSMQLYEQEVKFYTSVSLFFLQNFVYARINDVDESIRLMAVQSLTDAAISCPSEFADYQKLKCFEKILSDPSSKNRRDVLRCLQRILNESPISKNMSRSDPEFVSYYEKMRPLAVKFVPIILKLLGDRNNSVVSSAVDCLFTFVENNLIAQNQKIEELCINCASSLLSDESQSIRTSAAKFISRLHFGKFNEDESKNHLSILSLVEFLQKHFCTKNDQNENNEDDLPIVISSLFPSLICLHDWDEIIDILSVEKDNDKARILAKILLYSAEKLINSNSSSNDLNSQIRRLSLSLVKTLPILLKGYQKDDGVVLPLVDSAKLINLDMVSENAYEHYFQSLLAEICNIFLHSSNRLVFTTSIASLYELSVRNHQLSLIARRELDRLAVECGKDCDLSYSLDGQNKASDSSSKSLKDAIVDIIDDRESIAKFVAAARLVDVSDNGKLRKIVISRINVLWQVFEHENNLEFGQELINLILQVISDCIECLQFIFRWDIKHIHNKKIVKSDYKPTFFENLDIFYRFLTTKINLQNPIQEQKEDEDKSEPKENEKDEVEDKNDTDEKDEADNESNNKESAKINYADLVREQAFKALGDVIALSPFLKESVEDVLIKPEIIDNFYTIYHTLFNRVKKVELFSYVMHPIRTRAIEMSYASHILVYFGFNPLQQSVKSLWKEVTQGRNVLIKGTRLLNAVVLASLSLNKAELRQSSRFMFSKVKADDFISDWLSFEFKRQESEQHEITGERYEAIVAASLPFFFGIPPNFAKDVLDKDENVPRKYMEILNLIANNEKPTQKAFAAIIQASKSGFISRILPPARKDKQKSAAEKTKPNKKDAIKKKMMKNVASDDSSSENEENGSSEESGIESE